jgi:Cu2+-exporting ATPase
VAAAVAQAAGANSPIVGAVEEPGQGVRAAVDGVDIRLGRPSFCGAEQLARDIVGLDPEASIVAFSRGAQRYIFPVRQGLRPDATAVISALQARKIGVEILSGDRAPAVRAAAEALGIADWRAGVTPADKIARIEELKQKGAKVLMVGDGMNDAPSLAAAHVSMSPISAAHLSQSTADLVFLGKPLAPVVAAVDFSRQALHLMRQNLWLAIGYNFLAVPIAISGVVTPLIAAAAMSGSSILVMLNALRARNATGRIK